MAETEAGAAPVSGKQSRERSTIQFPYGDLADAITVATGLLACGGVPCDPDQLAAQMKHTPSSGTFRMKIATARIFGLIDTIQGKYQLTELGFAITDASREKTARADAFLKVPLYRRVYDEFRGKQLPPRPLALEHALVGFGVAATQKDRARQALDRSAQLAGYFDQGGRDRLVRPIGTSGGAEPGQQPGDNAPPPPPPDRNNGGGGGGHGGDGGRYHPFVQGLLQAMPQPGTVWTIDGRAAWLEAAANVFKLMYQGDGRITVTATPPTNTGADQA